MIASSLTDTTGIIALAAAALAALALAASAGAFVSLRRVRRAQRAVLGGGGERDLVAHASAIGEGFEALREYVGEVAERLDGRLAGVESALEGAIAHRALVRYDAYNEFSGRQSMSIALLDNTCSGIVLTCIHHRDQARVYAKQVRGGQSEEGELSPEEAEAIRVALSPESSPSDAHQPAA